MMNTLPLSFSVKILCVVLLVSGTMLLVLGMSAGARAGDVSVSVNIVPTASVAIDEEAHRSLSINSPDDIDVSSMPVASVQANFPNWILHTDLLPGESQTGQEYVAVYTLLFD